MYEANTIDWLQSRFDYLPLHQLCCNINSFITDKLASIKMNDEELTTENPMGMTPLHVLCSNPSETPDMIKQLISKNHNATQVRNIFGITPLHMHLMNKSGISYHDNQSKSYIIVDYMHSLIVTLLPDGAKYEMNEMIDMGLEYDAMDVVLALNGQCIEVELSNKSKATGLHPFMNEARSYQCRLADV